MSRNLSLREKDSFAGKGVLRDSRSVCGLWLRGPHERSSGLIVARIQIEDNERQRGRGCVSWVRRPRDLQRRPWVKSRPKAVIEGQAGH